MFTNLALKKIEFISSLLKPIQQVFPIALYFRAHQDVYTSSVLRIPPPHEVRTISKVDERSQLVYHQKHSCSENSVDRISKLL